MNSTRRSMLLCGCFLLGGFQASPLSAQFLSDPNFSLVFDEFIPGPGDTHTDTHIMVVGKPVSILTLSMISEGSPGHLPESEILLDLSNAIVLSSVNNDHELSVTASFPEPLPVGEYPATKVVFEPEDGFFHSTGGRASGIFSDGQPFEVYVDAGFVPEPSTLALGGIAMLFFLGFSRRRR